MVLDKVVIIIEDQNFIILKNQNHFDLVDYLEEIRIGAIEDNYVVIKSFVANSFTVSYFD